MTNEERTIDLPELTARIGLPAHEQSAVQAWSGENYGHLWTEAEAVELAAIWRLDAIGGRDDPEGAHSEADDILLSAVSAPIRDAYNRLVKRSGWWANA